MVVGFSNARLASSSNILVDASISKLWTRERNIKNKCIQYCKTLVESVKRNAVEKNANRPKNEKTDFVEKKPWNKSIKRHDPITRL